MAPASSPFFWCCSRLVKGWQNPFTCGEVTSRSAAQHLKTASPSDQTSGPRNDSLAWIASVHLPCVSPTHRPCPSWLPACACLIGLTDASASKHQVALQRGEELMLFVSFHRPSKAACASGHTSFPLGCNASHLSSAAAFIHCLDLLQVGVGELGSAQRPSGARRERGCTGRCLHAVLSPVVI